MRRTKSSKLWLKEHWQDPYVKQAQQQGYRSRAVYKLLALQETDRIVRSGMTVVDLGAAPGGWSQLLAQWVGKSGRVYAIDLLSMKDIPGVHFMQGDLREDAVMRKLLEAIGEQHSDAVLSDMAPNMSGIDATDQARSIELANFALSIARQLLKQGGTFIVKLFQGRGSEEYVKKIKGLFATVVIRKPEASRSRSREVYCVAKGFKSPEKQDKSI